MKQKCGRGKGLAEKVVKDIRQATWRQVLSEEKIRIVLAGLRGEDSIAELYRREGVTESLHYSGTRISWRRARSATGEVKGLCRQARDLKEVVAEQGRCACSKKHDRGWERARMRYSAPQKLEIIKRVEHSHLPVRQTLAQPEIPRATFYRWYDLCQTSGPDAPEDRRPKSSRDRIRIPDAVRTRILDLALNKPELSPRELAVRFTDYFVSEASVYRLLKARHLITSPTFVVIKIVDEFRNKTTQHNQL